MRYLKNFGLLLAVTGILAACQNAVPGSGSEIITEEKNAVSPEEETAAEIENIDEQEIDDEQLAEIVDKAKKIESYKAELNMSAALDGMEPRELNAEMLFINSEPPQLLLRSYGEDRTISKNGKTYFNNDTEWVDVSDSVDVNLLYSVTYDNAVASFAEIASYMETEKHDDKINYIYHGSNEEIYETIESLVQVNFGEMHVENVNSTVEITVDEESKRIEEINFESDGTDTHGTFELEGAATFDEFNEVDEIEIPVTE